MKNDAIWFKKIMGSYIPISWMGWFLSFSMVTLILAIVFNAGYFAEAIGKPDWEIYFQFLVVPLFIWTMIIADRHSE
jgi:hypothetical protein